MHFQGISPGGFQAGTFVPCFRRGTFSVKPSGRIPPDITTQPENDSVVAPDTGNFSVTATGAATLLYQWQSSDDGTIWADITGATSIAYETPVTDGSEDGRLFRCIVTNDFGSDASNAAGLTVNISPSITTHPVDDEVTVPDPGNFSVTAIGNATLLYQWQSSDDGSTWSNITGATAPTYETPATDGSEDGRLFRCTVTNDFGSDTSETANLTTVDPDLEFTVKTDETGTSNDDQFTIPTNSAATCNFVVEWSDGSTQTVTSWDDAALTHTFAGGAGTYIGRLSGTMTTLLPFARGGDCFKLQKITNWGDIEYSGDNDRLLDGCGLTDDDLPTTGVPDMLAVTSLLAAWAYNDFTTKIPQVDTPVCKDFAGYARGNSNLTYLPPMDMTSVEGDQSVRLFASQTSLIKPPVGFQVTNLVGRLWTTFWLAALDELPPLEMMDTSAVYDWRNFAGDCNVTHVPAYDASAGTNFDGCLEGNSGIVENLMYGMAADFSIANQSHDRDSIVVVFGNLADLTGLDPADITITGNPGVGDLSTADLEIATDKNRTVID